MHVYILLPSGVYFLLPSGVYILYCTHNAGLFILGRSLVPALEADANLWVRIGVRPDFVTGSLVGWPP